MKRILALFMLLCLLSLSLASCGGEETEDDKKPNGYSVGLAYAVSEKNSGECIITGIGSCTDKNIVIPTYINGMRVTGIAEGAFSPKSELGDDVQVRRMPVASASVISSTLAPSAGGFYYEANVGSADQGEGYETGDGEPIALEDIESVAIPFSVKTIGEEAFYGCLELEAINTPASLSAIGKDAFKETAYYNNPENWDGQALYLSNYLITVLNSASGEFNVKEGTTVIADSAFYMCEYVTTVNFASTVSFVGNAAFYGCTNLTYTAYSAAGNVQFGANAFDGCISYVPLTPGQGGVVVNPGSGVTPGTGHLFSEISEEIFENAKKNPPENYTCIQTVTEEHQGTVRTFKSDGTDSYYMESVDGSTVKELFIHTEEGGTTAYGWFGDGLYRTTATMPDLIGIPSELRFEDLVDTVTATKGHVYTYEGGEGASITFCFRDGALVLMQIRTPEYDMEIRYTDLGVTEVPEPSLELLVPGIAVDENGNPISEN